MTAFRKLSLIVLVACCAPAAVTAQEAAARAQEEVARAQEAAARNHEAAARLAEDAARNDPAAATRAQEAAARAQAAAVRAQEAADRAQAAADADTNRPSAQTVAVRAQEAANRAQESANRAQETANRTARLGPPPPGNAQPEVAQPEAEQPAPADTSTDASGNGPADTSDTSDTTPPDTTPADPPAAGNTPQDDPLAGDINLFLNRRFDEVVRSRLGPKNNSNQSETPSVSANSTSLVDKSSVGDLIGLALTPSGTTATSDGDEDGDEPTSASVTVTAYALKAFAEGRDPLDPSFYNANRAWRKLSFTYGYDYTEGAEGEPLERGSIYGIKYLPYDRRDPSDPVNQTDIDTLSQLFQEAGPSEARAVERVKRELYEALLDRGALPADLAAMTDERRRFIEFRRRLNSDSAVRDFASQLGGEEAFITMIDGIISENIDPTLRFTRAAQEAFDRIRRRPQVALIFLTKQRKQTRPDEYEGGLTMDLGVMDRWNLTFNGKFNYTDNKLTGDSRGGTFATELLIPLNVMNQLGDRVPWTFSFAASGSWATKKAPLYEGQAKLVIPFPRMPGVELPISVSFASRSDLLTGKESKIKGKIGFTFDVARFLNFFKNQIPAAAGLP